MVILPGELSIGEFLSKGHGDGRECGKGCGYFYRCGNGVCFSILHNLGSLYESSEIGGSGGYPHWLL